MIGTNRAPANFGIVRTTMRNVPDEMPNTAFYLTPGPTNPETWFYGAAKS